MSLILVYIAIAFTVTAIVFMVRPLFGSRRERVRIEYIEQELRMIEGLAAERATLLQQLRDLEFDRETNKVSDEDYKTYKRRFELQAIGVMKRLDAIRGGQNWDDIVDAELARHRGEEPDAPFDAYADAIADEGVEEDIDETPQTADEAKSTPVAVDEDSSDETSDDEPAGELRCASCGAELDSDDRFCRNCGAATPSSQDAAEASA